MLYDNGNKPKMRHIRFNGVAWCAMASLVMLRHTHAFIHADMEFFPVCQSTNNEQLQAVVNFLKKLEPTATIEICEGVCPSYYDDPPPLLSEPNSQV